MDNLNNADYMSKIQQIRKRITSKQSKAKDNSPNYPEIPQEKNNENTIKKDVYTIAEDIYKRRPLESVENKKIHYQQRVKELDSVSQRIKQMLSNKRAPINNCQNGNYQISANYLSNYNHQSSNHPISTKNEKITSLFQKQIQFSQSKVTQFLPNTDFKIRDYSNFQEKHNSPIERGRNTTTNHLTPQISEKNQSSLNNKASHNIFQDIRKNIEYNNEKIDIQNYSKKSTKDIIKQNLKSKYQTTPLNNLLPTTQKTQSQYKRQQINSLRVATPVVSFPETKKLLQILSKQIELQSKLRICKEKFDVFRSQNKLVLLRQEFSKRRVNISQRQLEQWIKIQQEEFDPFISLVFTKEFNFDQLICCLIQAKSHWEQKVKKCVVKQQLNNQGFKIKQIDPFNKNVIYLEDFVCFINLKNKSCLKNRDLFSVFKHLIYLQLSKMGTQHKIKYQTFINYVGK